jgi:hypothetical protein
MKVSFLERNENLVQQYGHLTEGVGHYSGDSRMAQMEENKMNILLDSAVRNFCDEQGINMNLAQLTEAMTRNANIATFVKRQLPLIRKVYPSMISRELVSTQPMEQPETKVFYFDIKRGTGDTSLSADIHNQRNYANNVEYNPDSPTAIKEIYLELTSDSLSATIKKLKRHHTVEVEQDLMAYHGMNAGSELDFALSAEITREWDRTIIQDMLDKATGGASTFDMTVPAGITYSDRKVWMEMLYEKMIDVDTAIYLKRYRKTNFIVVPAVIAGFMEKMHGFVTDPTNVNSKIIQTGGRYFMGTLNSRWRVYCDPFFPANKILMGYNNPSDWFDTSYVFCPYIMSYFSPVFVDPDTLVKKCAILSRAAMLCVVPDLLGYVTITSS